MTASGPVHRQEGLWGHDESAVGEAPRVHWPVLVLGGVGSTEAESAPGIGLSSHRVMGAAPDSFLGGLRSKKGP